MGVVVGADVLVALLEQVLLLCTQAFGTVEELRAATAQAFAAASPQSPWRRELSGLEAVAAGALFPSGPVVGAGFVSQPHALRDEDHWLEWWTADGPRMDKLAVETDPAAPAFRDYTRLPWFEMPRRSGRPHVHGPYVDYLCTEEYTLTFTAPVVVSGRFRGVVGADVHARTWEQRLAGLLQDVPGPAAVVNRQGRVVAGNDQALVTGDLLRAVVPLWGPEPHGSAWRLVRRDGLPFGVVVPA